MKPAPHAHQVRLRDKSTGHVRLAWPVDAREMLHSGGWEVVPVSVPLGRPREAPVPESPPTPPTHADTLGAKSYKELQVLARRAGLNAGQKKEELIAALLPLVEASVVSLEELPKVAPDPVEFHNALTVE